MSNCILTFKFGENPNDIIEVPHDGALSPNIDLDTIQILKNSNKWESILKLLENKIRNKVGRYEMVEFKDLTTTKGLLGNCNIQYLQDNSEYEFPEGLDANILLLENLKIGGSRQFGRIIKSDGTELFVLNDFGIRHFSNFMNLRQILNTRENLLATDSVEYKVLKAIAKDKTINEVIEDFSMNEGNYAKKHVTVDGNTYNVHNFLTKLVNDLLNITNRRVYNDRFTDDINHSFSFGTNKSGKRVLKLNIATFFNIVKAHHPDLLQGIRSKKDFIENFSTNSELVKKLFPDKEYKSGYHALIKELVKDPDFPYTITSFDGININFRTDRTIQNMFDVAYSTIKAMELIDSNVKIDQSNTGFKIYAQYEEGKTYYYPTQHYLTEQTITERFESKEEAVEYIRKQLQNMDLFKNSLIDLRQNNAKAFTYIPEGTIVELLDIPINIDQEIPQSNLLQPGAKYSDFEKFINSLELAQPVKNIILSNIKTPEQVITFLYKYNEEALTPDKINTLVNTINNASRKAFYIESTSSKKKNKDVTNAHKDLWTYKLIETEPNVVEQYRKQKNIPTIKLLTAISSTFKERFGINVNIKNYAEIQKEFPEVDSGVKAFIRNGEIYINSEAAKSSDLLHEYAHLLLGVLKNNSPEIYEQLLTLVANTKEGKYKKRVLKDTYTGISEMDLDEEVFADLLGEHLQGMHPNKIFQENEAFLSESTKNIFNLTSETDLTTIYHKRLSSIFSRFCSDVALKLKEDDGLNFAETINTRKKQDYINQQIKDGKIKEVCNG